MEDHSSIPSRFRFAAWRNSRFEGPVDRVTWLPIGVRFLFGKAAAISSRDIKTGVGLFEDQFILSSRRLAASSSPKATNLLIGRGFFGEAVNQPD